MKTLIEILLLLIIIAFLTVSISIQSHKVGILEKTTTKLLEVLDEKEEFILDVKIELLKIKESNLRKYDTICN